MHYLIRGDIMDIKTRLKNPLFLITLIGLFLSSTRIEPSTLTSWIALKDALINVFSNPFLLGCFVIALVGQFNNPTTPGIKD